MYADRYAPRRVNRGSLGLSVAIVGSMVATVMLSSTTIADGIKERALPTYWVKPTRPPPPDPLPRPEPQAKAKPSPRIDQPIRQVPAEQPEAPWVAPPGGPSIDPGTGSGAAAGVIDPPKPPPPLLTGIEVDPRYAGNFQPLYPPAEQRAGRDGVVTIKVLVGVDGRVVRAEQVMATSDDFWRVTLRQALGRWRFKPATRDGIPFEAWRTMTVRFRLEGS